MSVDSIIFDLDGTLWDSCRQVTESWHQTLRRHYGGEHLPDEAAVRSIMGMDIEHIAENIFSGFGSKAIEVCTRCIEEQSVYMQKHGGVVYSGLENMLRALRPKLGLYIVSNCQAGYIECFFSSSGLGKYFVDHECNGVTGLDKAGNIALIMRRNRLCCPVFVGDTLLDEQSAEKAGIAFVHAAYGFGTAQHPTAVIDSPEELIELIERL